MKQKTITKNDLKALDASVSLSELLSTVYDACLKDGKWAEILTQTADMLGGKAAGLVTFDLARKSGRFNHSIGLEPGFANHYGQRFGEMDVWLKRTSMSCNPGEIKIGSQITAESILLSSEFHRDWLAPQNLYHAMWATLACRDDQATIVMVYRGEADGPFGEAELDRFWAITPHLQRALRIHELVSRAQLDREAAIGALDHLPIGVILLDGEAKVLETNNYANDILSMQDGLKIARRELQTTSRQQTEDIRAKIIQKAITAEDDEPIKSDTVLIERPSGQSAFSALISPLPVAAPFLGELRGAAALFITDPDRHYELSHQRLQEIYELTPAEARLAGLVAQGFRLEEAAEDLGVSLNTVRTHLKRIFAKTRTDRQADLVRLILAGTAQVAVD